MSKMTKRQRAQVVELLRCGAHDWNCRGGGTGTAASALGLFNTLIHIAAVKAWNDTCDLIACTPLGLAGITFADTCLEAAQRVEEGTWP